MAKQESGSGKLNQLLAEMNQNGGFPISVLTDAQGLAIASSAHSGMDTDRQSAVVASIQKMAGQVARQLGMGATDEIALNDENGQRLICRPFQVNDHELILAVIVPGKGASYRRATNQAINDIRQTWKQFWE
jgi:predicted regulator of Ras-like GTPase activity (Roadblock/LC7/MglB family)